MVQNLPFKALSINDISHVQFHTMSDWAAFLAQQSPKFSQNGICAKTVLFKPKAAAGAAANNNNNNDNTVDESPILVIAADHTQISATSLAKSLGYKDARFASETLLESLFQITDKSFLSPFLLSFVNEKKAQIHVIIDSLLLANPDTLIAFRTSNTSSRFLSSTDFRTFLDSLSNISFKNLDFTTLASSSTKTTTNSSPSNAITKPSKNTTNAAALPASDQGQTKIGMEAKKELDFPAWYQQVLTKTEMMDYYDISGCYIIRPWAYKIWKSIQTFFGSAIEDLGVEDCYFPMFVSARALNREKDHIEGFAPEVAWVTKAGNSDLAEHIAVRPTSETVMYPAYAQWVRSHRDLPLRLNQWCNVVRWEFKHPQPFLRTREFLWQEGHTAFATKQEADQEVLQILNLYRQVYEDLLAVPVVPGKKSEKEKFAGGLYTTTVEGFIPTTGRAIQGATSHCLGENFSKMFNILIENENGERAHVWQNSWGLTTRTIGVMVMIHGDDKGLVLPPRVASIQAIVIPVGITAKTTPEDKAKLVQKADDIVRDLKAAGLRAKSDTRDNCTAGFKYNHWELKGVPVRIEVGPKDLAKNEVRVVVRHNGSSMQISLPSLSYDLRQLLETIQTDMFNKAKQVRDERLMRLETWDHFITTLNNKCMVLAPWCEAVSCEEDVKERSARTAVTNPDEPQDDKAPSMGAKTLCIPFQQPTENPLVPGKTKCFACGQNAKSYTLWGRSY